MRPGSKLEANTADWIRPACWKILGQLIKQMTNAEYEVPDGHLDLRG